MKDSAAVVIDGDMKTFTRDEIELLLQGLGILRDVYEDIVAENVPQGDTEPCAVHQLAIMRLTCTRDLIAKCRELEPRKPTPRVR